MGIKQCIHTYIHICTNMCRLYKKKNTFISFPGHLQVSYMYHLSTLSFFGVVLWFGRFMRCLMDYVLCPFFTSVNEHTSYVYKYVHTRSH